ncbi:TIGR04141 family sporadically distributed protein [Oenococcus oeni]|uniref:TIGR04141 family sporadically distributed protein n=1 Tax=Oenococcus oeni TaxID=1247 RepID=UPI0009B528BC
MYIKKGDSSANLSHLFLQGQVAATLISDDMKMRSFIAGHSFGKQWLNSSTRKEDMTIVFGVIRKKHDLPFFR